MLVRCLNEALEFLAYDLTHATDEGQCRGHRQRPQEQDGGQVNDGVGHAHRLAGDEPVS